MKHSNVTNASMKQNLYKEKEMENGSLNTTGYVANAMYDNIRGFGYGYGSGYGSFASPSANAVRINRNDDLNRERYRSTQFVLDQAEESRRFAELKDGQFRAELRTCDKLTGLGKDITDARFEAKDCCCETQKEILQLKADNNVQFGELKAGQSALSAKMDSYKEISELVAENNALKTQIACGCVTGCSTPCPSPCVQS